jgi:hypothetical protein
MKMEVKQADVDQLGDPIKPKFILLTFKVFDASISALK